MPIAIGSKSNQEQMDEELVNKVKQNWSAAEDARLVELVHVYGPVHWPHIAKFMPQRTSRQCRERWNIKLNPDVIKGNWTFQEDTKIAELYKSLGSQWTEIAKSLTCRVENDIRNRFLAIKRACNRSGYETVEAAYDGGYFKKCENAQSNNETKSESAGTPLTETLGSFSTASKIVTVKQSTSYNSKKRQKCTNTLSSETDEVPKTNSTVNELNNPFAIQNMFPAGCNYLLPYHTPFPNFCDPLFSNISALQEEYHRNNSFVSNLDIEPSFKMNYHFTPVGFSTTGF